MSSNKVIKKSITQLGFFMAILSCIWLINCGGNKEPRKSPRIRKLTRVVSPSGALKIPIGQKMEFDVQPSQDTVKVDSYIVTMGTQQVYDSKKNKTYIGNKTGKHSFSYLVQLSNGKQERHKQTIIFVSDSAPKQYTYRKVNTYTHDPDAYTQGLYVENGYLFESTGQRGTSSIRKVDIASGNVIKKLDISDEYFGEGIASIGDELFMLTYTSNKGFVYSKTDFTQRREFQYPGEGWGLTTKGDTLVMSNGSENLVFNSSDSFSEISRLQVYDNEGKIENLNELEYINGQIYANIYQTEKIAIIDPKSGKVTGIINLEGIFNRSNYSRRTDVLNGIAYDEENDRIFVTGKWWPKLYEIELVPLEQPTI
ncbi:MAG: glutaminyl-peptide cyclotransferase [Cyclobacteriaceae bacterium]